MSLQDGVSSEVKFASLPPKHAIRRIPKVDPTSRGLLAAGARIVNPKEFRTCAENGATATQLANSSYEVWAPPERRITAVRNPKRRVAVLLGPNAHGDATNYLKTATETPPAMRRSSPRGSLHFLHAPFRTGAPASLNTDASRSFPRMGYQSSRIALDPRDGRQDILLDSEGTWSRGSDAPPRNKGKWAFVLAAPASLTSQRRSHIRLAPVTGATAKESLLGTSIARARCDTWQSVFAQTEVARYLQIGIGQRNIWMFPPPTPMAHLPD